MRPDLFYRESVEPKLVYTLFEDSSSNPLFVKTLLDRTEIYLEANGIRGYLDFEDIWFAQHADHRLMARAVTLPSELYWGNPNFC